MEIRSAAFVCDVTVALTLRSQTLLCKFCGLSDRRSLLLVLFGTVPMNAQKEKVIRELDTNIYKIMDSYRQLLKKGTVNGAGEVSTHEELQVETATISIVRKYSFRVCVITCHLMLNVVSFHTELPCSSYSGSDSRLENAPTPAIK